VMLLKLLQSCICNKSCTLYILCNVWSTGTSTTFSLTFHDAVLSMHHGIWFVCYTRTRCSHSPLLMCTLLTLTLAHCANALIYVGCPHTHTCPFVVITLSGGPQCTPCVGKGVTYSVLKAGMSMFKWDYNIAFETSYPINVSVRLQHCLPKVAKCSFMMIHTRTDA
jgi:hypothetical protein